MKKEKNDDEVSSVLQIGDLKLGSSSSDLSVLSAHAVRLLRDKNVSSYLNLARAQRFRSGALGVD